MWSGHACGCVREPPSPFSLPAAPQRDVPVDTQLQEAKGPDRPGQGHTGSASRTTLTHEWGMRGWGGEVPERGQTPELLGHNPQPKMINVTEPPGRQHWDQGTGDTRLGSRVPGSHFPQGPKSSLTLCLIVLSGAGCLGARRCRLHCGHPWSAWLMVNHTPRAELRSTCPSRIWLESHSSSPGPDPLLHWPKTTGDGRFLVPILG